MKACILTYHSHHVLGAGYDINDHVAFPADLELITALGYRIVELGELRPRMVQRIPVDLSPDNSFRTAVGLRDSFDLHR